MRLFTLMTHYVWLGRSLLIATILGCLPHYAYAVRACNFPAGTVKAPIIEVPSATGVVGINDGRYPSPTNITYADPTSARYGSTAPTWSMVCTAPVQVTPLLINYRPPDTRFTSIGWPAMQNTTANYYSFEMWYEGKDGQRVWYGGKAGATIRAAPFILAENASPTNPVTITLQDLGLQNVGFQGYQAADATAGNFIWGAGGGLNNISFEMVNYTSADKTAYNDFKLAFYIDRVNFLVRTCAIVSGDLYKNINLGSKIASDFSSPNVGGTTTPVEFKIGLRCVPNVAVSYRVDAGARDTVADPSNTLGLMALQGANPARGFAIQLRALPFAQESGGFTPVIFGKVVTAVKQTSGNLATDFIKFDARYFRTKPAVDSSSGSANATATIMVNYQ